MKKNLPPNNLGLYRIDKFVGRARELKMLSGWLDRYPVLAITGPSGTGKSTLATMLAVRMASRFNEGILWTSATGDLPFNFYDIVRGIEGVLGTGITNRPVDSWPLLVLQQLYGFDRLLILDELTDADSDTVDKILNMIGQLGPGGRGRFILLGRDISPRLLEKVGVAHLRLKNLSKSDIADWADKHHDDYLLNASDVAELREITNGHPLLMRIAAKWWRDPGENTLTAFRFAKDEENWDIRSQAVAATALSMLSEKNPLVAELLSQCLQFSGGFTAQAVSKIYGLGFKVDTATLTETLQLLYDYGLVMYNPERERYYIHPLIRRYINLTEMEDPPLLARKRQCDIDYARYYLRIVQLFSRTLPEGWHHIDSEWGNIRNAFTSLVKTVEAEMGLSVEQALTFVDSGNLPALPPKLDDTLILIRDYALAVSVYILWRHPPESRKWMSAGIIAGRGLTDRRAQAIIGIALATLAYFHQDYPAAQVWYRRSLPFFKEIGDRVRIVQINKDLGMVLRAMGNFDEALKVQAEALVLAAAYELLDEQAAIQSLLGSIHYARKEFKLAIDWHQEALFIDLAQQNYSRQGVHYNNIGLATEADSHYDRAVEYYRQAAKLLERADNKPGLSIVYGNLGAVCYRLGRLEEALEWYKRDRMIRNELGNWLDMAAILHNMGHIALELDELPAAVEYFARSRDLYSEFGQAELADEEQSLLRAVRARRTVID